MKRCRKVLRQFLPPVAVRLLWHLMPKAVEWRGDYPSWAAALSNSDGYDTAAVFDQVLDGARKVRDGLAAYERDSVVFEEPAYVWPVLSGLLLAAARNQGRLDVLDMGGALGSLYFQHRAFLAHLASLRWAVVEQAHVVEAGRREFQDGILHFHADTRSCLEESAPNVVLMSGVVQYVPEPYALLEEMRGLDADVIVFDRTPFLAGGGDRLTVQKVSPRIYPASYPAWFLDRVRFDAILGERYRPVASFADEVGCNVPASFEGGILVKR